MDSSVGRFGSKDPILYLNLYRYVSNNPCIFVDAMGLWTFQLGLGIFGGAVLGFSFDYGFLVSYDKKSKTFKLGFYSTEAGGSFIGVAAGTFATLGWSGNDDIMNFQGYAPVIGGSLELGPGLGFESTLMNQSAFNLNVTLLGGGAELHAYVAGFTQVTELLTFKF